MITSTDTDYVLKEIETERKRQDKKWGEQNHPDGTGGPGLDSAAVLAKYYCDTATAAGACTYALILHEEVTEAFAETDKAKLRAELIQVAAVAVAWVEKLDRGM